MAFFYKLHNLRKEEIILNRYISQLSKSQQAEIRRLVEKELKALNVNTKMNIDNAMNGRVNNLYDLISKKELKIILKQN